MQHASDWQNTYTVLRIMDSIHVHVDINGDREITYYFLLLGDIFFLFWAHGFAYW
jgi:hypothetical protein